MKSAALLALCASAGFAIAGPTFNVSEASISDFGNAPLTPSGDGYFHVAGLGGAGGFAFATLGAVDDTFDGLSQVIGVGIVDGTHTAIAETDTFAGAGSSGAIMFGLNSDGTDFAPTGFTVGGLTADAFGIFVGANAGANPLDSSPAILVSLATVELFDAAGGSLGVSDITAFSNFTAGAGGTWDGSMGVAFGSGSAGAGIVGYKVTIEGTLVPAPASAALLGLGGIVALRRRR